MNAKNLLGLLACFVSSSLYAGEVSGIIAISSDQSTTSYVLSDVQRINVYADQTDGSMTIVTKNGNEEGDYQKLLFASVTTTIDNVEEPHVYVYPSPVVNTLYVKGVDQTDTRLAVFDLNGRCLLQKQGNEVEVASLTKGTYILRVNNHSVKFIKD